MDRQRYSYIRCPSTCAGFVPQAQLLQLVPRRVCLMALAFFCACIVPTPHHNKLMELEIVINIYNTYMDRQMYGYISFPSACTRAGTVVLSPVLCVLARTF